MCCIFIQKWDLRLNWHVEMLYNQGIATIYYLCTDSIYSICQWPGFHSIRYHRNTEQEYDSWSKEFRNKIQKKELRGKRWELMLRKSYISTKSSWVDEAAICRIFSSYSYEYQFSKRYWRGLSQFYICKVEVVILYPKVLRVNKSMFTFLKLFQEWKGWLQVIGYRAVSHREEVLQGAFAACKGLKACVKACAEPSESVWLLLGETACTFTPENMSQNSWSEHLSCGGSSLIIILNGGSHPVWATAAQKLWAAARSPTSWSLNVSMEKWGNIRLAFAV